MGAPYQDYIFTFLNVFLIFVKFPLYQQAWKNETLAEQAKLPATEKPVLLSKDIEQKLGALDREVQYLLNKAKFAKPKPKPKQKSNATESANGNVTDTKEKVITPKAEGTEGELILVLQCSAAGY